MQFTEISNGCNFIENIRDRFRNGDYSGFDGRTTTGLFIYFHDIQTVDYFLKYLHHEEHEVHEGTIQGNIKLVDSHFIFVLFVSFVVYIFLGSLLINQVKYKIGYSFRIIHIKQH